MRCYPIRVDWEGGRRAGRRADTLSKDMGQKGGALARDQDDEAWLLGRQKTSSDGGTPEEYTSIL